MPSVPAGVERPLSVVVFAPLFPPHVGGLESYTEELSTALAHRGTRVTVFTAHLPRSAPLTEERNGMLILRFPAVELLHNYPVPVLWNMNFWRRWSNLPRTPDVVISETRFFLPSLLALVFARARKRPRVHLEHGSAFEDLGNPLGNLLARFYDRLCGALVLRSAARVVAVSSAAASFARSLGARDPVVIYRGVDVDRITRAPPALEERSKHRGKLIVCYVGQLIYRKRVADLLRAFATLPEANAVCLIVGDGPERARLEQLTRALRLDNRVVFFGSRPSDEALGIMKIADVFVSPSLSEGLPTTVIEAALCERAILATDAGGTREIIADGTSGLLVPPRDTVRLRDALWTLLRDPELRQRLGAAAAEAVAGKFSWERSTERLLAILRAVSA